MKIKQTRLHLTFLFSFVILVLCTGCPYESEYPMTGRVVKYDATILGSWKNGQADLVISRVDDENFRFQYNDYQEDFGAGLVKGKGFIIEKNDSEFAVIEQATTPKTYMVFKINSIRQNTMKLNTLSDELMEGETFSSATAFTRYILDNEESIFDEEVDTYTRTR